MAHASAQRSECDKIVTKLRSRGFKVFYSPDTIPPSEDFDRSIRAEIARSNAMIFLLSAESVAKGCYALTELQMASARWPNPRNRVLAIVTNDVPLESIPNYLRHNIELFKPRGDLATEAADAMLRLRDNLRRSAWMKAGALTLCVVAAMGAFVWKTRLAARARLDAVTRSLIGVAEQAPVYLDTCVTKLDSFGQYPRRFTMPEHACNARAVAESLPLPALVVSQTGYGKKGFLQSLRGILAAHDRPSVLVSYRDCARGHSKTAPFDLTQCLVDGVRRETNASVDDVTIWLRDPSRYVLIFDAIDDSASREAIFHLVERLWLHQRSGGTVVLSAQPQNLNYLFARYGLEDWVVWLRDKLPTADVRGIYFNSVQRIATSYEEHRVPLEEVRAILDFPQRCPKASAVVAEWIAQPKLFRERGTRTVSPVVDEIRKLGPQECEGWRSGVLAAMLRARIWSYCHDELCNYLTDGDAYILAAQELRGDAVVRETRLTAIAQEHGFQGRCSASECFSSSAARCAPTPNGSRIELSGGRNGQARAGRGGDSRGLEGLPDKARSRPRP